ncbi:MAG: septum formation initiator family protein [Oscillospiraceae bacterium]|jgi:cell division protein DivIC|nr:septum formation initiator family protein [Oscillospiraceae bacterium]MBQ4000560.1 septum formation initiator family protein [Oscillospiraceae bacterium]MBQ4240861.1 septum formation initiator family protein [Oscillospiraceae bacterium]MBQ5412093.1 septum formation initiator family protein [Oscillospiraceae bacterium]
MRFAANNMTEKEKKELTGYINRRRFILILLSLFCVYLLINVVSIRVRLYEQKQQLNLITEQIEIAQLENDELRHMMSGTEAEYIERIAREKLGYAAVDERVYEDITGID